MKINIHNSPQSPVAELISEEQILNNTGDLLDLLGNARYQGAGDVIIHDHQLTPAFFELKTRLAGEFLQKISNYRMRIAIIGDFEELKSKNLSDFIRESNRIGRVNFVANKKEALNCFNHSA